MSCKCGCFGVANPGKDYINGHQRRGKRFGPDTIAQMRESQRHSKQRPRVCVVCIEEFAPTTSRQSVCGSECKTQLKARVRNAWMATGGREKSLAAQRAWYAAHPERSRDYARKKNYGISRAELGVLYGKQEGLCAICCEVLDRGRKTHVDHCHQTEKVRGLLCGKCNVAVGMLKDDPELMRASARYVEFHTAASAA